MKLKVAPGEPAVLVGHRSDGIDTGIFQPDGTDSVLEVAIEYSRPIRSAITRRRHPRELGQQLPHPRPDRVRQ